MQDVSRWGVSALPPLTMAQASLLMDAMSDCYAVGFLHGQRAYRERKIVDGHDLKWDEVLRGVLESDGSESEP